MNRHAQAINRPDGSPLARQSWGDLLFLHWPLPEEQLRPLVPAGLELDTFAGAAWVGLTPFALWGTRPRGLPAIPLVSSSLELNARTYVIRGGVPGVWFLSLDASNPLAVLGGRIAYAVPYYWARMSMDRGGTHVRFRSRRIHPGAPAARLEVSWSQSGAVFEAEAGTLEHFLIERYCLYAESRGRLYRASIHHRPWPLRAGVVESVQSTVLESHGLRPPDRPPLAHVQAEPFQVEIWPEHAA